MSKSPIVAIVGRANVGKSSLFNRLVNNRQAIVADEPGTTRDAVHGHVVTASGSFVVVDTAGLKIANDDFEASIQDQITEATAAADLIIMVVDATTILSEEDKRVAKLVRKSSTPVVLAINKSEGRLDKLEEFDKLGFNNAVATSASQGQGISELIAVVTNHIKPIQQKLSDRLHIALIGRPNVGKSSLFNKIGKKQQAVVADIAGTTRDVNRLEIQYKKQPITLLDTAGIRKSGKIERGIERFSVMRAIAAIEEADVCLLVIDATEPGVALEQKLAGVIKDAGKGLILVPTKWDLIDKDSYTHDQLMSDLKLDFQHVPWALFSVASAQTGQNTSRLLDLALDIQTERNKKIETKTLNRWLLESVYKHPPAGLRNKHPKLKYVTQTGQNPPEFTIFGSHVRVIHWSYKRYLERELRQKFGFEGTAVKFSFKDKD